MARRVRRRSSILNLVIVIAIIALLSIYLIGSFDCTNLFKRRESPIENYIKKASELINLSNQISKNFITTREKIQSLDRVEMITELQKYADSSREIANECSDLKVPEEIERAHGVLQFVFDMRAAALDDYKPALLNALEDIDVEIASIQLSRALEDLHISDRVYEYYKKAVGIVLKENKLDQLEIPESYFLQKKEIYTLDKILDYINAAKGVATLQPIHGVAVLPETVEFDPKKKEEQGEYIVLLYSEEISVTISIENQGNQVEKDIPIKATLKSEIEPEPVTVETTIPEIKPKEVLPVILTGIKSFPGSKCLLKILVGPVTFEQFLGNNEVEFKIMVER